MTRRLAIILTAIITLVVIVATVSIVVAVNASAAATRESDYRACVTAGGMYKTTDTGKMAQIADRCYSSVYD